MALLGLCAELKWCWVFCGDLLVLGARLSPLQLCGEHCPLLSFSPSLSLFLFFKSNGRPPLSRSRRPSFHFSRFLLVNCSLCHRRTPASVPTLASQTASTARRRVAGRRRWTSTATRFTSATILMRRYRQHCTSFLGLSWEMSSWGAWHTVNKKTVIMPKTHTLHFLFSCKSKETSQKIHL